MAELCGPARRHAPAIWVEKGNGTTGPVSAQTLSMSQLLRWKWKSVKPIATGIRICRVRHCWLADVNFAPAFVRDNHAVSWTAGDWLQTLKEVAPAVKRIAVVFNPQTAPYAEALLQPIEVAARTFAVAAMAAPANRAPKARILMRSRLASWSASLAR